MSDNLTWDEWMERRWARSRALGESATAYRVGLLREKAERARKRVYHLPDPAKCFEEYDERWRIRINSEVNKLRSRVKRQLAAVRKYHGA